jgi:hypothetical protein
MKERSKQARKKNHSMQQIYRNMKQINNNLTKRKAAHKNEAEGTVEGHCSTNKYKRKEIQKEVL